MLLQSMLQGWINYTAGERGDSLSFLQPVEMDYLQDLEKHGVSLTEYLLLKVLDSFPLSGQKHHIKKFISLEKHIWLLYWQKALESFIFAEVQVNNNLCKINFFFFFLKGTLAACYHVLVFIFSVSVFGMRYIDTIFFPLFFPLVAYSHILIFTFSVSVLRQRI